MPSRSLHVIDTLGMGGAETWLMEILRYWSKVNGPLIDFLVTSGNRGIFDDEAAGLGSSIYYVPFRRDSLLSFAITLRRILRSNHYTAIHDHQGYISGLHYLLGLGCLPSVRVVHFHNPSYQVRYNYGISWIRRLTNLSAKILVLLTASHITGTSLQLLNESSFTQKKARRIPVKALYCGFNTKRFAICSSQARQKILQEFHFPNDALVALFTGRIDVSPDRYHPQAHKNAGFAVDVGISAAKLDPRFHLLLAGKRSPAVLALEKKIAEAGLSSRIKFLGVRTDIEVLMAGSDVFFFPSRAEGLGLAAVEAQAAGLHVLASSAVPQEIVVIPDQVHFKQLDDPVISWAECLLLLANFPKDAVASNKRVSDSVFSVEHSSRCLQRLYERGLL